VATLSVWKAKIGVKPRANHASNSRQRDLGGQLLRALDARLSGNRPPGALRSRV